MIGSLDNGPPQWGQHLCLSPPRLISSMNPAPVTRVHVDGAEEAEMSINVPGDGRYRVGLLVFKAGKVAIKGSGVVDLRPDGGMGSE